MIDKSTNYMLSVAASIYGVLAYTIAFSLEIWFIFNIHNLEESSLSNKNHHHHETQFIIPMTALIQASIYFVLVILSLFLVLGVIIKSIVCLLCWIIAILLSLLPETSLVIYTTLNVWRIETRNGQIELCFFVFRFIMNTFFVIFVYNLIKQWKKEKMISSYMNSRDAFSAYPYITTTSLRLKNNHPILTGTAKFDTFTKYNPNFDTLTLNDLTKFKSLSVKGLYDFTTGYPYYTYFEGYDSHLNRNDHLFPSEFDTNSFRRYKMIRKPIDLEMNDKKIMDELKDQYYAKKNAINELTLSNSIRNSVSNSINLDNQIVGLSSENVVLRQLATKPFDYLSRPGSVMNLNMPFESDENFNTIINDKKNNLKKIKDKDKSVSSLRDVAL